MSAWTPATQDDRHTACRWFAAARKAVDLQRDSRFALHGAGHPVCALIDGMAARTKELTPVALSNHLAFLQMDLADPEFRQLAGEHARAVREQIQICLDAAVAAGQLSTQDTARLARSVQVAYNGAVLSWALEPEGRLDDRVRQEIETTLAAFCTGCAARNSA